MCYRSKKFEKIIALCSFRGTLQLFFFNFFNVTFFITVLEVKKDMATTMPFSFKTLIFSSLFSLLSFFIVFCCLHVFIAFIVNFAFTVNFNLYTLHTVNLLNNLAGRGLGEGARSPGSRAPTERGSHHLDNGEDRKKKSFRAFNDNERRTHHSVGPHGLHRLNMVLQRRNNKSCHLALSDIAFETLHMAVLSFCPPH